MFFFSEISHLGNLNSSGDMDRGISLLSGLGVEEQVKNSSRTMGLEKKIKFSLEYPGKLAIARGVT